MKKFWFTILSLAIFVGGAWGIITVGQHHLGNANATTQSDVTSATRTNSTSSSASSKKTKKTIRYAALGDGIANGTGATSKKDAYQYLLAADLRQQDDAKVTLSGQWNAGGTVKGSALPALTHILAAKPDLITIQYGNSEQNQSNLYAATTAEYQVNLTKLVQDIKQQLPKAKIVILSPWQSANANAYAAVAKSVADSNGTDFVNLNAVYTNNANLAASGYPNKTGNAAIAKLILNQVASKL